MRKYLAFILIVGTLSACSESDPYAVKVFELNDSFEISADLSFGIHTSDDDTITTHILSLSDSRCPSDVTCIRAGDYSAELEMILFPDTAYASLCNGDCNRFGKDSTRITLKNIDYWVRMDDLTPYPTGSNPDPDYKLHLTIFEVD